MVRVGFAFFLFAVGGSVMAEGFKKISVVATNNAPYFVYSGEHVVAGLDLPYLKKLKAFVVKHGFKPDESSEVRFVLSSLAWVNAQWDHDGMNEPPKGARALEILRNVYEKKEKYRCVEFGLVLSDLLQSYGFITRTLGLRSKTVAYGGFGQGHVAMEAWLNEEQKWVFLDGQFGVYITKKDSAEPLSYFEIYGEKAAGRWADLQVHFVKAPADVVKETADYKDFLSGYFGHMTVSAGANTPRISLQMESLESPVTFQGGQSNDAIFTKDASLVYPQMNRTSVILHYAKEQGNFQKLMATLKIDSDEKYLQNMGAFAAEPAFIVNLRTTAPLFDYFEYRLDPSKKWSRVKGSSFKWNAKDGANRLEVRAMNKLERAGAVTFMDLTYQ